MRTVSDLFGARRFSANAACPLSANVGFKSPSGENLLQNPQVRRIVIDDQDRQVPKIHELFLGSTSVDGASAKCGGEMERRAVPTLLSSCKVAVHQLDQLLRDRQPQPGASEPPRRRSVGLREGFEDSACFSLGIPMPVSRTLNRSGRSFLRGVVRRRSSEADIDHDLALIGELDGVAHQVHHHLAKPAGIAEQAIGNIRRDTTGKFETLFGGAHRERSTGFFHQIPHGKGDRFQFQFAGFDLGKIEDIVQQPQQRIGRISNQIDVVALFVAEIRFATAARTCR